MVAAVGRERLRPVVSDVFAFELAAEAFALMEAGGQFGKIVLKP
jgi:NADPH:quinone reductase-like Zn-dependent oxidoreductase